VEVICHVISGLMTGGAERALGRLLAHGLEGRFENHVICLGKSGPQAEPVRRSGARVHVLGLSKPADALWGVPRLRRLVDQLRPSLLQGWMYHGNMAALLARPSGSRRVPLCWNIRQSLDDLSGDKWTTRQLIRVEARLSGRPDAIIYNSRVSARQHEEFGYSPRRRFVIYNGFQVEPRVDDVERAQIRTRLGLPQDGFLFAHLARWHPMKDHKTFIAAAADCAEAQPNSRFFVAGKDVAANVAAELENYPSALRERFVVRDEIDDPMSVLRAADALVVSSRRAEGFPNVLGEAMVASAACITTRTGESADVVGDDGLVVPPADAEALAQAMIRLARDPATAKDLGARGRRRVEQLFDIKAVVAEYEALYRRLIAEQRVAS
jgi:glycosyltransferase involved in cell wall biosynthesis